MNEFVATAVSRNSFERHFLEACLPTFAETLSGWGLDWVWPHRLGAETRRSAIIDAVAVTHTRPVGGPTYGKLREAGITARDEATDLLRKHGVERDGPRVIAAIDGRGTILDASTATDAPVLRELLMRDRSAFEIDRKRRAATHGAVGGRPKSNYNGRR